jgi:hypothetical protein
MKIKQGKPLLLMAILFMACEVPEWIITDLPPVTQPVTVQPDSAQPVAVQPQATPFVLSKPVVEINARINSFKCAGIVFKLLNKSEKHIEKLKFCFVLFDTKTQTIPFSGTNKFEITKNEFLAPGENKEICISLDQYIYIVPTEPYIIDFFYISEIHYIDGAVWLDTHGKYRVRW